MSPRAQPQVTFPWAEAGWSRRGGGLATPEPCTEQAVVPLRWRPLETATLLPTRMCKCCASGCPWHRCVRPLRCLNLRVCTVAADGLSSPSPSAAWFFPMPMFGVYWPVKPWRPRVVVPPRSASSSSSCATAPNGPDVCGYCPRAIAQNRRSASFPRQVRSTLHQVRNPKSVNRPTVLVQPQAFTRSMP